MLKRYEDLTFSDDFMFCKIMQNESICKEVLEILLKIKIQKIDYLQKQKNNRRKLSRKRNTYGYLP